MAESHGVADMETSVRAVENLLNYRFVDKKLLEEALTHPDKFLGDAAISSAVTHYICNLYPNSEAGELKLLLSVNISTERLARVAVRHKLYMYIRHNSTGQAERVQEFVMAVQAENGTSIHGSMIQAPEILADILKSVAGAVYRDCNYDVASMLRRLYNLGARKFVIAGLGVMGCIPSILAQNTAGVCSADVNALVRPFNTNTKIMIRNLSTNLPGSKFSYIDVTNMFQDLLDNSRSYGFSVLNRGCCGIGRNRGQITCLPFQTPCPNRNQYIFWDAFHPTEAVNVLFGNRAFSGGTDVVYPINIQQLALL